MPSGVDTQWCPEPAEGLARFVAPRARGDGDDIMHDCVLPWTVAVRPSVSRAQTQRPVDQVEDEEHDREHHEENVVHLGPVVFL